MTYLNKNGIYAHQQQPGYQPATHHAGSLRQGGVLHAHSGGNRADQSSNSSGLSGRVHQTADSQSGYYNRAMAEVDHSHHSYRTRSGHEEATQSTIHSRRFAEPYVDHPAGEHRHRDLYSHPERPIENPLDSRTLHESSSKPYNPLMQTLSTDKEKSGVFDSSGKSSHFGHVNKSDLTDSSKISYQKDDHPYQVRNTQPEASDRGAQRMDPVLSDYRGKIEGDKVNLTAYNYGDSHDTGYSVPNTTHLKTTKETGRIGQYYTDSAREGSHLAVGRTETPTPYTPPGAISGSSYQEKRPEGLHFGDAVNHASRAHTPSEDSYTPKEACMSPYDLGVRGIPNIGNSCYM